MKENRPDLLKCQVEQYLRERGHEVIYTALYTPKTQPIEKFWGNDKNYCADHCWNDRTMKQTVRLLQE
eukprot:2493341-Ditylum_brightwellii.AAC.1